MVVISILSHAEFGPNDHRKDAPLFISYDLISAYENFLVVMDLGRSYFCIGRTDCLQFLKHYKQPWHEKEISPDFEQR